MIDVLKQTISNLFKIKSVVTITMTIILACLLLGDYNPPQELLTLYCTSYGAVLTYYFTRKDEEEEKK